MVYKKLISPALPHSCRFVPSCSSYMMDAIKQYGVVGVWMGAERILRCNPFNCGGVDPVPDNPRGQAKWVH
ncbi:MAG: membrane protein insertion efficiency factor YidD [Firmicutes bacterium]|nr:membrane protein insertion efficiency factor YidD [Bacillota bacterium]